MFRMLFVSVERVWWRRQIDVEFMRGKPKKKDHLQEIRQVIVNFVLTI